MSHADVAETDQRLRIRAGVISLVAGAAICAAKFAAFAVTHSAAVLSDALESIVNVVAASFLIGSVFFAGIPADRNHPYGHGKIEFFSAVFEGGLVAFAAIATIVNAVDAFFHPRLEALEQGLLITGGAAAANLALGVFLLRVGRRAQSPAIVADGHHVLSDVWTSAGVLVGLGLVALTSIPWLDPMIAAGLGLYLAYTGFRLVRRAAGALLDEEDTKTVRDLLATLEEDRPPGIIRVHYLRAIRSGRRTHVDAHLVMPEFWTVDRAHAVADAMERRLHERLGDDVDVMFHSDPCRRAYCSGCDVADCPVRAAPFVRRPPLTIEEATHPDPPKDLSPTTAFQFEGSTAP